MPRSRPVPIVALLVLAAYAWLFPWIPSLRSPNELSRLYQARALVDDHSLSVNQQIARHGPVGDLSMKDGRYYPNKAPGVSLLGAVAYAAVRGASGGGPVSEATALFWLRLCVCMVPGAVAAELLRRVLRRRFDAGLSAAGAIVYGLGTIAWPYSTLFMSHGPTAAAVVACWWALENAGDGSSPPAGADGARTRARRWWVAAGFFGGCAVLLEYTSALALPPLFFCALVRRAPPGADAGAPASARPSRAPGAMGRLGDVMAVLAGAAAPAALLAVYHAAAFGHPLETGYRHLVNPTFARWHARGFLGIGAPSLRALAGSFLDPARVLFAWSPFLALGLPGLAFLARRDRAFAVVCGAEVALYALFTASFTFEAWGWVVGPRHITTTCAFLVPPALACAERLRARGLGFVPGGLALFGLASLAATMAVCPYLPDELTNPLWQLVVPLAREGLRSPDVVARALHTRSALTLAPWLVLVAALAAWTSIRLSVPPHRTRAPPWMASLAAVALALTTAAIHSRLGGPDRFAATRRFISERLAERP